MINSIRTDSIKMDKSRMFIPIPMSRNSILKRSRAKLYISRISVSAATMQSEKIYAMQKLKYTQSTSVTPISQRNYITKIDLNDCTW